ncbi:CDP-alcohol phosphatidyltransferase family protein [Amycolatopsis sp. QT-25]|uniref:CDP-alcohol phosphatidyltransferase family protein n=1 Tax=Amycolatopsis sp. QT-25 TaxID=3034022 RepID=UPI0023EAA429|nr:CDP-alcohol phosphatidyltransferase family protein [Amycolatopsis sp. QT-25]WET76784.1 CDP-alcohol phosphatidyltransferase family protein [Amycolatopsis sp. QT-25]
MQVLARPVLGVPPDVLTGVGVLCAAAAVPTASAGGWWLWLALVLLVATGVFDGLDGAVALLTGKARPAGAVLDAVADRITELCFTAVLFVLGAPSTWCAGLAISFLLHEYLRVRAQAAGMRGAGAITVAERPTRLIVAAVAVTGSALAPAGAPWSGWPWAPTCAVVWAVLSVMGLVHLSIGTARALPARRADQSGGDRG